MDSLLPPVIAIDGPSASGKGTLARRLAAALGFAYLDTGLLYRAVARTVLAAGGDPADPKSAQKAAETLDIASVFANPGDPDLRTGAVGAGSSAAAAFPAVRAALLKAQQDFAARPPAGFGGAVLDGRDIGTVVAPRAPVKLYVTASPETRAARRCKELLARGEHASEAAVLADLQARDARDLNRATAPAKPAADAVLLDTTNMTADEAFAAALAIVRQRLS